MYISGRVPQKENYVPTNEHPFDHFVLVAKIQKKLNSWWHTIINFNINSILTLLVNISERMMKCKVWFYHLGW
jgi:hypothetical protein